MIDLTDNLALIYDVISLFCFHNVSLFHCLDTEDKSIFLTPGDLNLSKRSSSEDCFNGVIRELDILV